MLRTGSESPRLDAELLLAHAAGCERSTIVAFPERVVAPTVRTSFARFIERRQDGEPVAYVLGAREFYSLPISVTPAVLVPRPETELIVDTAIAAMDSTADARVLDLGTGSGAIALAIKRARPQARVTAIDVSSEALVIAKRNARALGLDVELIESSWFTALAGRQFDLIVSNPPYVASDDPSLVNALKHEPRLALDGGSDGLDAIRLILGLALDFLSAGGVVLIEHGEAQGGAVRDIAARLGYRGLRSLTDLAGHERVLVASAPARPSR